MITKWRIRNGFWYELTQHYLGFTMKYKRKLYENYNIDCGTDYANYTFNSLDIKH